jgi:hypothetical protein
MVEKKPKSKIKYLEEGTWGKTPISILPSCTINELKCYISLSSFQGSNKNCWPSLEEVANRASITPPAASEAISSLVKKGFVTRQRNFGKSNTYKVLTPTVEPERIDCQDDPDNCKEVDNSNEPDVSFQGKADVEFQSDPDDIRKEHLKTTKENNIDPAPIYKLEEQPFKRIQKVIDKFLKENSRGKCKEDGYNLTEIVNLCVTDNIEDEVLDMCVRFKNHPWWWEKYSPQPRRLVQAWDQLLAIDIPEWKRHGYGSEYEYNLKHKTQPSHAITYEELQTYQEPKADPEQISNFLESLETLKT